MVLNINHILIGGQEIKKYDYDNLIVCVGVNLFRDD